MCPPLKKHYTTDPARRKEKKLKWTKFLIYPVALKWIFTWYCIITDNMAWVLTVLTLLALLKQTYHYMPEIEKAVFNNNWSSIIQFKGIFHLKLINKLIQGKTHFPVINRRLITFITTVLHRQTTVYWWNCFKFICFILQASSTEKLCKIKLIKVKLHAASGQKASPAFLRCKNTLS